MAALSSAVAVARTDQACPMTRPALEPIMPAAVPYMGGGAEDAGHRP